MEETGLSTEFSSQSTDLAVSTPSIGVPDSAPSTDVSFASGGSVQTDSGKPAGDAAPAVYSPNYKVKAYDAEYEIPENFRSFINEKNEKEFRQLFSKAYGLEVMQGKNVKLREENEVLKKDIAEKYAPLNRGLDVANKYLANKDYDSFFDLLKINEGDLQTWMLNKLRMKDLPPEQQEIYNRNSTTQKQLYQLEQVAEQQRLELESIREANYTAQVQQRSQELDTVLSRPDIKAVADRFDTQQNQAGAFKNEVVLRAQFVAKTKGTDLSAEQAVQEFMKLVVMDTPSANPNQTVILAKDGSKKPILPNLAGQTTSPAAQKITSMADLQKLKKQAIASMNQNN